MHRVHRTFRDLSKEELADIEQASLLVRMGWSSDLGWEKLLESRRVLIVSEAGAGKTHECRAQCGILWAHGEPSFFFELAQLANSSVRDLLSPEEELRFDSWFKAQSDVATFFLDSIDELKLTLGSYETALKKLNKCIAGQLSRARIVVTSRPIAIDQQMMLRYLPIPEPMELVASGNAFADIVMGRNQAENSNQDDAAAPDWRNVALMPLSDDQIRQLAKLEGVDDADALLADIRSRDAEDFARRPQDLIEICADWRAHRRIRSHRDQVLNNIDIKLKPRAGRHERAELSPDKAFNGASRLALAALLTRKLTIRFSVEADKGNQPGTALDPDVVLHDWTREERETLLERALFGFASYGRVRFHHRSVLEFLAARRLEDRLSEGAPLKLVKRLLFAETPRGVTTVRPTMRPVAAWLAGAHLSIFSEVRKREPAVLLEFADPASLPIAQRADALQSYVQRYGHGGWRGLRVPRLQVKRFAAGDLDKVVSNLWRQGIDNGEVRELLLELIGAGPMPACANIAHAVATNMFAEHGERLDAIVALVQLNDPRIGDLVRSLIDSPEQWSDALSRGVVLRLFPDHISPDSLCKILQRIEESSSSIGELGWVLPRRIAEHEFDPTYLAALRSGLTSLVTEGLAWKQQWPHIESTRSHLLPALSAVCLRFITAGELSSEVIHSAVVALRLSRESSRDEPAQHLRKALSELASVVREVIFWADDEFNEGIHPVADAPNRLYRSIERGPLDLDFSRDKKWLTRTLANAEAPLSKRAMMLHALMHYAWDKDENRVEFVANLKNYVSDARELVVVVDRYLAPPAPDPETERLNAAFARRRKRDKKREEKDHASWVAFWQRVAQDADAALGAKDGESVAWNLWQAMRRSGEESRASGWSRRFIEQYFGKEVADKLRNRMQSIWRADRPTLRSERPPNERNTILVRWELGLAAVTAEAEDVHWVHALTFEEAKLATRYATLELNGIPEWVEALARKHPVAVEETLGPELTFELEEIAAEGSFFMLFQNLRHAPDVVVRLFLPRLAAWFDNNAHGLLDGESQGGAFRRLEQVVRVLVEHGGDEVRDRICTQATGELKKNYDGPFTQIWIATLMRIDPAIGVAILEQRLVGDAAAARRVVAGSIGSMFGDRHGGYLSIDLKSSGFTPRLLLRLVRLAYRSVRPEDDIVHEGVFSPGPRDEAQDGRSSVLNAVLNAEGNEAWDVKLEMVEDPLFAHFRDRLGLLAREKAAEEADCGVLNEADMATFDRYGETLPSTRDEMFTLLVDRLDDLDDFLVQDASPRDVWVEVKNEKLMRRLIANQLTQSANHVYTLDQEAVTAEEKETDIRLRVASSGQEAVVELKIGENSSGRELRDTIKDQLVRRYMAAESCRSGCLLVTVASNCQWVHPETGEKLTIDGLRAMLKIEADRVADELGHCVRLAVKVLDLRRPGS